MIDKIVQLFKDLPDKVGQAVSQFVQSVLQQIQQWAQNMVQQASQGIQNFAQAISQGLQQAMQAVQQGIQNLARPFQQLAQSAMQWGKDFIGNFAQGIMGAMGGLLSTVMSMASSIASYLHFSKPDVGPLADADQWMPDFGDMLTSGLNDQVKKVGSAARNVAVSISGATPNLNGFSTANSGTSEQTQVLKQILMELRSGNQAAAARGTIGYRIPSTELGSINQQFNSYNTNAQAAQLYNQINTLGGLAQEYAARGARTGLGF
jgi:phage-related protein